MKKTPWERAFTMAQKYMAIVRLERVVTDFDLESALAHLFADAWYSGYKAGKKETKRVKV